jgi:hypothetical protein
MSRPNRKSTMRVSPADPYACEEYNPQPSHVSEAQGPDDGVRETLRTINTVGGKISFLLEYAYDYVLPPYTRAHMKYKLDTWMAKRAYQMIMLVVGTAFWVLTGGLFYSLVNNEDSAGEKGLVSEALWAAWTVSQIT